MEEIEIFNISTPEIIYTAVSGDSLKSISAKFNVPATSIKPSIEGEITAGDKLIILNYEATFHVVKPGQTLSEIAGLYEVSVDNIKELNKVTHTFVGQHLIIPKPEKE